MVSTLKIFGLISCGFLLYLGLSNAAQAADEMKLPPDAKQPGGERVGGQSGEGREPATGTEGEAGVDHTRQPGGPRVGGQSGQPAGTHTQEGEAGVDHTRQPGDPRIGGQSGK